MNLIKTGIEIEMVIISAEELENIYLPDNSCEEPSDGNTSRAD